MPIFVAVLLLFTAMPVSAQISLGFRTGHSIHAGHSIGETLVDSPELRPGHTVDHALELVVPRGRWSGALAARRSTGDMIARGTTTGFITADLLVDNAVSLSGGYRLSGMQGATADLNLGIIRHEWGFRGLESSGNTTWGVIGGLGLSWAPVEPIMIELRSEIERSGSFLKESDLPEGYELKAGHRVGFSIGLRWHPRGA